MENGTKLRLLYLYQHLIKYTDAQHPISTPELIKVLHEKYGVKVNRNTLADDFAMLEKAGFHFEVIKSRQNKYYCDSQPFDLAELKVLIDAVSSSKFITEKKSKSLISKLTSLTNVYSAANLRRHVHVDGRVKSENESGYQTVDIINEAIDKNQKIRFQYADYSVKKRKVVRHDGAYYVVSPYALVWDGDYYYMIGYSEMRGRIQNFRLDRIYRSPELVEEERIPTPDNLNLAEYSKQVFRMYDTDKPVIAELLCENNVMNAVIDQFGTKVRAEIIDDAHFKINVRVCASPTFYRWIFGWRGAVKILGPEMVREEYREMCTRGLEQ